MNHVLDTPCAAASHREAQMKKSSPKPKLRSTPSGRDCFDGGLRAYGKPPYPRRLPTPRIDRLFCRPSLDLNKPHLSLHDSCHYPDTRMRSEPKQITRPMLRGRCTGPVRSCPNLGSLGIIRLLHVAGRRLWVSLILPLRNDLTANRKSSCEKRYQVASTTPKACEEATCPTHHTSQGRYRCVLGRQRGTSVGPHKVWTERTCDGGPCAWAGASVCCWYCCARMTSTRRQPKKGVMQTETVSPIIYASSQAKDACHSLIRMRVAWSGTIWDVYCTGRCPCMYWNCGAAAACMNCCEGTAC